MLSEQHVYHYQLGYAGLAVTFCTLYILLEVPRQIAIFISQCPDVHLRTM